MLRLKWMTSRLAVTLLVLASAVLTSVARSDSYEIAISEEISGNTFLAMRVAAEEFERQMPELSLRDFNITVFVKPEEISVLFQHIDASADVRGSDDAAPSYSVILTPDGSQALRLYTPR